MSTRSAGRVVDGRVRVDIPVEMPDNTEVELTVEPRFDLDEEEDRLISAEIEAGRAQVARGDRGKPAEEVIDRLFPRSRDETLPGKAARKA
jgi:hypothetical protein